MTHVDYDFYDDIAVPLSSFLKEMKFTFEENSTDIASPNFDSFKKPNAELIRKSHSHPWEVGKGRNSLGNNTD